MKKILLTLTLVLSSTLITFSQSCDKVFIPNSFTPNNDGLNDTWSPIYEGSDTTTFYLSIYDRSGSEIFRSENKSWDGNINGYESTNSTYVYRVIVGSCNFKGILNVIE